MMTTVLVLIVLVRTNALVHKDDHACFVNAHFYMHFKHVIALHLTQRRSAAIETASNKASCHLQKLPTSTRDIDRYIAYFEVDETAKV